MVDVRSRTCNTECCAKHPSLGVAGTRTAEYCEQYAKGGLVNVTNRKCTTEGCAKQPSFGVVGTIKENEEGNCKSTPRTV